MIGKKKTNRQVNLDAIVGKKKTNKQVNLYAIVGEKKRNKQANVNAGLCSGIDKPLSLKVGTMIDTNKLYSLLLV